MKVLYAVVLAGCASGTSALSGDKDAAVQGDDDAAIGTDAIEEVIVDARPDAPPPPPPDAFVPDAFVPPDACVPIATQLLANPVFDGAPVGMGWQQTPIDAQFPLITGDDGVVEHSAPFKAWLGGLIAPFGGSVTDVLFQDVLVPANTTQLVLTGFIDVRTDESPQSTIAFDTGSLAVTMPDSTPIVTITSLSNLTPKTTWTPINHTFAQNLSNQTIRIRMTSSSDDSLATSFYFDTMALTATHGCPL